MDLAAISLCDYTSEQLRGLCKAIGFAESAENSASLLNDLLGPVGTRALSEPPSWPSDVADDKTPIEFSIAFEESGPPTLRVCLEPIAEQPSHSANLRIAQQLLNSLADRFQLSLERFHAVEDLFLQGELQGKFVLWYSLVLRPNTPPEFKIYFNPEAQGITHAPQLVKEALTRLGFDRAYSTVIDHAVRRGMHLDRFSFFSLDLDERACSRVKVYVSHHAAEVKDVERAASAARGVEPGKVRDFCHLIGGGRGPFIARPLVSSYTFVEGDTDRPSGYTLHLPIRDYVTDDESARARVIALMTLHGLDPTLLDRALTTVARRPLRDGVGLIPYASLRMGLLRPGVTVYLSSEAYGVTPPRSWRSLAEHFSHAPITARKIHKSLHPVQ